MSMKNILLLACIQLFVAFAFGQGTPAYTLFNSKGKKISYRKMVKQINKKDILLFGELHNNPIAHWLQYELTSDMNRTRQLILGAEMIETDNQEALDKYLNGDISSEGLDTLARLWSNYDTDYAPLVDFAKENNLVFIATNIPRRYARLVHYHGFEVLDTLPSYEKEWIAPLPIAFDPELPTYKNIMKMMGDHASPRLVMAQAIKDATMAHSILKYFESGHLFIHYNGSYHSDHYEGILWYLKNENDELKYTTITTILQSDIKKLKKEHLNKADYIICVDENMTTTY